MDNITSIFQKYDAQTEEREFDEWYDDLLEELQLDRKERARDVNIAPVPPPQY